MAVSARYVGGHPDQAPSRDWGKLRIDSEGIVVERGKTRLLWITWANVDGLEVAGADAVQDTRAGNVIAFGALGLLASEKRRAFLVVTTKAGVPTVEITGMLPNELRAHLVTVPEAKRLLDRPAASASGEAVSVADEIRKLADLRAEGLLTDEEFQIEKRRLLGS